MSVIRRNPPALEVVAVAGSIDDVNQLLAEILTIRDSYSKRHLQSSGPNLHSIHLLFEKHFEMHFTLVTLLAERVQMLGVTIATASDVTDATLVPRAPQSGEDTVKHILRLLHTHEVILLEARTMARHAQQLADRITRMGGTAEEEKGVGSAR